MLEQGSAMAFAMMLMLAGPQPAATANVPINARLQGDAIHINASAMLNADAATAWCVLASRYALTSVASRVRLDCAGPIVPGFELVGRIEQMVVERNAARRFQALADESERGSAALRGHARRRTAMSQARYRLTRLAQCGQAQI